MPIEDIFTISWSRHGSDGSRGAREGQGGRRDRDRGIWRDAEAGGDRGRDVPEAVGRGNGWRQCRDPACEARTRTTWSGGWCWRNPGSITPHTKFKASIYALKKEEGGRHTPFFHGIPTAVLFSDDGCDRVGEAAEGVEMVMPG